MKSSVTSYAAFVAALAVAGIAHAQTSEEPASPSVNPIVSATDGPPPSGYVWAGAWFSNHYAGGYGGAMKALNRDKSLWGDGPVLRVDVSAGQYSYNAPGFSNKNISIVDADVVLGYRKNTSSGNVSAYVGPVYLNHDNPDPAASIRGSKVGAVFLAEYSNTTNGNLEVAIGGRFATPFSSYSASGRLLYKISEDVWLGPQFTVIGNNATHNEITAGPFVKFNTSFGEIGIAGGYRHPTTGSSADGYFASVYFAAPFGP